MAGPGSGSGGSVPPVSTHTQNQAGMLDAQAVNLTQAQARQQFVTRTRELQKFTRDIKAAQEELLRQFDQETDEEVKQIYLERTKALQSQLENEMHMYQNQYSYLSDKLSAHDKQFHEDMYLHRKDDLRKLEREIRYRMEDIDESVGETHNAFEDLTNMLNTFNLNHLTDSLTDTAQSFVELKREMSKQLNWSAEEWRQYSEDISEIVTNLNNKISRGEVGEIGSYVTMELGINDEELVVAYTEALTKIKLSSNIDPQSIDKIITFARRYDDDYINTVGDYIKAIANTDLETTNADMAESINGMIEVLNRFNLDPELTKSMIQQFTAVQAAMDNQFMGEGM